MKALGTIAAVALIACAGMFAKADDSPQQRLEQMKALQAKISELQSEVVRAPDDRKVYRSLIDAGLQLYELIYTRHRFPEPLRSDILDFKLVVEDMYSIQKAVAEMGGAAGIDGKELARRLASRKMPLAHRRAVPLLDPWGTPYRLFVYRENGQYKIVSAGRAKQFDQFDLSITEKELMQAPERRNGSLASPIVFIDGRNLTRLFDYPKEAQTFLYTFCEPADELHPERVRCW